MALLKKIWRILFRSILIIFVLLLLGFIVLTAPAWKNKWVDYPKLEKEQAALQSAYQKPEQQIHLLDFKGVLHSHSYWSHDSRGVLAEILPAAEKAKLDFIFLSDHKHAPADTFPRGFHGSYGDMFIEAGTESNGMMITPMDTLILDWNKGSSQIIKEVVENGGMAFYVHSEEDHDWGDPNYQGMEIYNIHTDFKDEENLLPFLLNSLINGGKYRNWAYRELYNEQTEIWALWDSLNQHRRIVGMAAVDAHDNQSIRARYLPDGKVEWVGSNAETISIVEPGWKENLLLGEADTAGWVFKWGIDSYFHSFNHANTHVLADSLSPQNIRDHLLAGHAYISFESLLDATGFQFFAQNDQTKLSGILGDSIAASEVKVLKAISPFPVKISLFKEGEPIQEKENVYEAEFRLPKSKVGNYRVVASLKLDQSWATWVMTNPIYVFAPSTHK